MQAVQIINPFDIDEMVISFIRDNQSDLDQLCAKYYGDNSVAIAAFEEAIKPELKKACINFVNNNYHVNNLKPYLISVTLNFFKKEKGEKKKTQSSYVCPGCKYLDRNTTITFSKVFRCEVCTSEIKTASDPKLIKLLKTFSIHSKKGYKCNDCFRWLPHPIDNSASISCPYYDCCFVGTVGSLKEMKHPTISSKITIISLDKEIDKNIRVQDSVASATIASDSELELKEDFEKNLDVLKDTIQSQVNSLYYNSTDATLVHKLSMYQAFLNLIEKYPEEMVSYLVMLTRHGGLQHRIFQEYVSILEKKIPFSFKKNGKIYKITSLLDEELKLFEGVSVFDATVSDKKDIKNGTEEFYIGGRKGSYSKAYYIGKLLDVFDLDKSVSILPDVKEYSFSKIKLKSTAPETKVRVSHLRVPPHYQMGGMVHLNRLRRKIVDKVYFTIHGCKREIANEKIQETTA